MSMDRLVELFLASARPESEEGSPNPPFGGGPPDEEAIARGMLALDKLVTSDDAVRMGGSPQATFVCMGMAMEEKPMLLSVSVRCYEKALEYMQWTRGADGGGWEESVVLQQLGAVGLRLGRIKDAQGWLRRCSEVAKEAHGHPRECVLFHGGFSTKQSRNEFLATIEKMRAQCCGRLNDRPAAYEHLAEAKRLEALASGGVDVIETMQARAAADDQTTRTSISADRPSPSCDLEDLWSAVPAVTRQLRQYRFLDEGSTVLVVLELNEHLGIGAESSDVVDRLGQFKVRCEADAVSVQLRLKRKSSEIWHFDLSLDPLCHKIVPEDTVPKLRGKEGKRRLEIKLFKLDKEQRWYGDIVRAEAPKRTNAAMAKEKGSMLNPLTPEELARLPTPPGSRPALGSSSSCPPADNTTPVCLKGESTSQDVEESCPPAGERSSSSCAQPSWVLGVQNQPRNGLVEVVIEVGEISGQALDLCDLELEADADAGIVRLRCLREDASDKALEIPAPAGVQVDAMRPKWRRKTRSLELSFPYFN